MLMTGAIPVEAAQAAVLAECRVLPGEPARGLRDIPGRVLAEPVVAPRDIPQAPTSIVDGFAVCSADFDGQLSAVFSVRGSRADGAAGAAPASAEALQKLEAAYVTTGALLPPRADAVRPSEESQDVAGGVQVTSCEKGKWVRWPGSDMQAGSTILKAGQRLTAMDLSALAAAGVTEPVLVRRPKVAVLSTGRELVDPEAAAAAQLAPEKIFDANRHMLLELVREEGAEALDYGIAEDDAASIRTALDKAAGAADIVVCSGGVSEGDFDFVRPALQAMGRMLFEKVIMKPGKPASCTLVESSEASPSTKVLVFGLPGNPASAAVTFRLLVAPALQRLAGRTDLGHPVLPVRVRETVAADPQRPEWVRAGLAWQGGELVAMHTGLQRSSRAASLAGAVSLLELAQGQRVPAGGTAHAMIIGPLPGNSCKAQVANELTQQLEAATFRQLVAHLRENPYVQNIDLMNLAGFCRNCLSKWYMKASTDGGVPIDYDGARELVYGMPYDAWKKAYQTPATDAQKAAYEKSGHAHAHSTDGQGCCKKNGQNSQEGGPSPPSTDTTAGSATTESFQAAALSKLVAHLRENPTVQNIDLMNLSGFCRNCLSKWYMKAAAERGVKMEYDEAREVIYGMTYNEWKKLYQTPASSEQLQAFNASAVQAPAPAVAPKHSDVCSGGTEQGKALEALEAAGSREAVQFPKLRVGVLTVSDRASAKVYADLSGPAVAETLKRALGAVSGFPATSLESVRHSIVPDERCEIERALVDWCAGPDHANLVLTTGGTGFAPRDVTPEATKAVCEKEAPGLALATLQAGAARHPLALASRLVAGIRHRTVILNLPGNPNAVQECLEPVVPLLLRAVALCDQPLSTL